MDVFHRCAFLDTRNNSIKNVENIVYLSTSLLCQILDFVVQYFVRHFFLFLQSPYFLSICTTYHSLFLSVILMHCISLEELHVLSCLAVLCMSRNMFLKHDFLARIAFFFATPCIPRPNLFLIIKMLLFCQYMFQVTSVQRSSSYFISVGSQQSAPPDVDSSHS